MLIEIIYDSQFENDVQKTFTEFINRLNIKKDNERKIQNHNKVFNTRIGNKIIWPKKVCVVSEKQYRSITPVREINSDNESSTGDFYSNKLGMKIQYESQLEKELLSIIENSERVVYYVVQPFNIPYYYLKERQYIPDIFCILDDGRGVVIEAKPRFHMALDLNLQKYHVLRSYCQRKGYGMLVTDARTSIEEFIQYDYNKDFEKELLIRLDRGPISWGEFSKLKIKYNINFRDIASIVIKNNLLYDVEPFTISIRNDNNKGVLY